MPRELSLPNRYSQLKTVLYIIVSNYMAHMILMPWGTYRPITHDVTGRARWAALEDIKQFSMGKVYRGHICHSFARNVGISFSYSRSMLDYSQHASRYHFVGWCTGTTIEQEHFLVLASTILHSPLYSNMAANSRSFADFLVHAMGLYKLIGLKWKMSWFTDCWQNYL